MTEDMWKAGIFSEDLVDHVISITSICNRAMHGEDVSDRQVEFIRGTIDDIIGLLRLY